MLEARGLPTVAIGLVRPHMEATIAPRGLFVPFPLGRPLGEPGDAAFQRRVLLEALSLLEHAEGPVVLEDFADDAPGQHARGWQPAVVLRERGVAAAPAEWARLVAEEIAELRPAWERAQARFGRTTVGVSRQSPAEWPAYVAAFLDGGLPAPPAPIPTPALGVRFVADDLKAYYQEAAQAEGGVPSPNEINGWFYRQTAAGRMLAALREVALASPDNALTTMGGRFLVPAMWL
jgi:hypothetical protein